MKVLTFCSKKTFLLKVGILFCSKDSLFHGLPPVVVLLPLGVKVLKAGDGRQRLGAEAAGLHEHLAEVGT